MLRDGFHQQAVHGGVAPYKPNSLDGGCPFFAGADGRPSRRVRRHPGAGRRGDQGAREPGVVRRPLQPGPPVLAEHDPGREGAHRPGLHLRARQVLRAGHQGAPAPRAGQHRPGPLPGGGDRSRPAGTQGDDQARGPRPQPGAVAARRRVPAGRPHGRHRHRPRRRPVRHRHPARDHRRRRHGAAADRPARRRRSTGCRSSGPSPPAGPWSTTCCWSAGAPVPAPDALPGPRREGRRRRDGCGRPAGPADARGVLPARQGHRRLGRRRPGPRRGPDHRGRRVSSPATTRPPSSPRSRP